MDLKTIKYSYTSQNYVELHREDFEELCETVWRLQGQIDDAVSPEGIERAANVLWRADGLRPSGQVLNDRANDAELRHYRSRGRSAVCAALNLEGTDR